MPKFIYMELSKEERNKLILGAFIKKQKLTADEVDTRFELACSIDYWRKLNPQLTVCENLPFNAIEKNKIEPDEMATLLDHLEQKRYFNTKTAIIDKTVTNNMLEGIKNLKDAGWHEVWSFVYDEFWQVTRTPSLLKLLSARLGENFKAMPHVVVHYVKPGTGSGWSPHIDFNDRKDRFTVWLALSDATLDNGCMYIVDRKYISEELLKKWTLMADLKHTEAAKILQATRALPIEAGTLLGWEGDVIHWGAHSASDNSARISLSVVYLRENIDPMPDEIPLLSAFELPTFAARMISVAKAINYYNIHVLALHKFKDISTKLTEKFANEVLTSKI